jgi:hypothetical protein
VAHEEGNLNDIRAILGNDAAIKAYREEKLPLPEGTMIAPNRMALRRLGGEQQSFWPSPIFRSRAPPDWYLQFMQLKEEEVWLNEYPYFDQAALSIARWIEEYNHDRPHRGLHGQTPHDARVRFALTLTSNTAPCV